MPVMEGKAMLFKEFAGVDAFPICLGHQGHRRDRRDRAGDRPDVRRHQPRGHLRAALLRDRGPPEGRARHPGLPRRPARHGGRRARRAHERLQAHRQARLEDLRVLVVGLGAAGVAVTKILMDAGVRTSSAATRAARCTPARRLPRRLDDADQALVRRDHEPRPPRAAAPPTSSTAPDLFIGLSGARVMPPEALAKMNDDAMVFAMANPTPRSPRGGRAATRGSSPPAARTTRTRSTTSSASRASSAARSTCARADHRGDEDRRRAGDREIVAEAELREDYIIPSVFNRDVAPSRRRGGRRGGARRPGAAGPTGRRSASPPATAATTDPTARPSGTGVRHAGHGTGRRA